MLTVSFLYHYSDIYSPETPLGQLYIHGSVSTEYNDLWAHSIGDVMTKYTNTIIQTMFPLFTYQEFNVMQS